jgi:hypothetical protein
MVDYPHCVSAPGSEVAEADAVLIAFGLNRFQAQGGELTGTKNKKPGLFPGFFIYPCRCLNKIRIR